MSEAFAASGPTQPIERTAPQVQHPWALAIGGLLSMAAANGIDRFIYTPILPAMAEAIRNHADQMPEGAWDDMSPSTVMNYYGAHFDELNPGEAMRDGRVLASGIPYSRKEVA